MEDETITFQEEDDDFIEIVLEHEIHILQEVNNALTVRCAELAQLNDNTNSQLIAQKEQIEQLMLKISELEHKAQQTSLRAGGDDAGMPQLKVEEIDLSPLMLSPEDEILMSDEEVKVSTVIPSSNTLSAQSSTSQMEIESKPAVTITLCNVPDEKDQSTGTAITPVPLPPQAKHVSPDVIRVPGGATLHIL